MQHAGWIASGFAVCSLILVGPTYGELSRPAPLASGDTLICIPLPEVGVSVSFPVAQSPRIPGRPAVSVRREEPAHSPLAVKVDVMSRGRDPSIYLVGLETRRSLAGFDAAECEDCSFTPALDPASLDPQRAALAASRPWESYRFVRFGSTSYLADCQYNEPSGSFISEYLTFVGEVRLVIAVSSEAAAIRKKGAPLAPGAVCDSLRAPFDSVLARVEIEGRTRSP